MSEISEEQQLTNRIQALEERMKKLEDQLVGKGIQKQDMVTTKKAVAKDNGEAIEQDSVPSELEGTEDIKPYEILTIEGIINLIHIRNWERLKQFKLQAKIVVAATRESSQYGKTRPQEIIISDEKNQRFKLLNWSKSLDQELKDLKDQWVIFDSVYLKENDRRFPDNQFMFFTIRGEEVQFSFHSSKKFKIIISISQKILGGKKENE